MPADGKAKALKRTVASLPESQKLALSQCLTEYRAVKADRWLEVWLSAFLFSVR
jgi:hypothetical protein